MNERIVITGYGICASGAESREELLHTLLNGIPSFNLYEGYAPYNKKTALGFVKGSLKQFDSRKYRHLPRFTKLALLATQEALASSKSGFDLKRSGVFLGTSLGGSTELEQINDLTSQGLFNQVPVYANGQANYHSAASALSHHFQTGGVVKTSVTGCTAGLEALQDAIVYMQSGKIDRAIVCGSDSAICRSLVYSFAKTRSVPLTDSLDFCGLPFSSNSEGFIISEGAATILIEKESDALRRGATIFGVVDQIASNNDLQNINGSDATGAAMLAVMKEAAKDRKPDYINSQALGSRGNDTVERLNLHALYQNEVPITTIKGLVGHNFGASGISQLIASLLSFEHRFIPGVFRTNLLDYDELNVQLLPAFDVDVEETLLTSHGYGGNNVCAYLTKY